MLVASATWGTVSVLEVAWTLIGVVGAFSSLWNISDIRRQINDIDKLHTQLGDTPEMVGMMTIAAGHFRNEMIRVAKCGLICMVGFVAMVIPPANQTNPISPLSVIVTFGVFGIATLITLASMLDRRQRLFLAHLLTNGNGVNHAA